jgi:hypothetical protein
MFKYTNTTLFNYLKMTDPYWCNETPKKNARIFSVRGDATINRETYDEYLQRFIGECNAKGGTTEVFETNILVNDFGSQYCTIISSNVPYNHNRNFYKGGPN